MESEKVTAKIAALPVGASYFSLEFFPPKTQAGSSNLSSRLQRMSISLRPLFVSVTWGAGGSTADRSLELAELTQRQVGLTTVLHLTCTNSSLATIENALASARSAGIRNILALRGDPPRGNEYDPSFATTEVAASAVPAEKRLECAADLVRFIREKHGDYFCIGVAAYPEGHADESHPSSQSSEKELPYLVEKTKAGADFIMTQLFYDAGVYLEFEKTLREHPSGVFKDIPIIPGLMPVQSYQILQRTTKLSHASVPPEIQARLDAVKNDDEAVKQVGVDVISEIIEKIKAVKPTAQDGKRGFHFYTLNLEKAVSFILDRCSLIPEMTAADVAVDGQDFLTVPQINGMNTKMTRRRHSSSVNSDPHNRVVADLDTPATDFLAPAAEAGQLAKSQNTRANTLAISEGEGARGREATWDDFPNGRFGDARSPAYGEIDGYGVSLHVSVQKAISLWSYPQSKEDISEIFKKHILGQLEAIPWSEEQLRDETLTIRDQLIALNEKGWWTVASQPAVDGARSEDPTFGWGPKGGFVYQKAFVEFFCPASDFEQLKAHLDSLNIASGEDAEKFTYFACSQNEENFLRSFGSDAVNAVTWGCFPGKEIVTPTIIEEVSFIAWVEEAFGIWKCWGDVYRSKGGDDALKAKSVQLIDGLLNDMVLVNVVHHDYPNKDELWDVLIGFGSRPADSG